MSVIIPEQVEDSIYNLNSENQYLIKLLMSFAEDLENDCVDETWDQEEFQEATLADVMLAEQRRIGKEATIKYFRERIYDFQNFLAEQEAEELELKLQRESPLPD